MNFNLRVSQEMFAVYGRLLRTPDLQFGAAGATIRAERGSWNLLDRGSRQHAKFLSPVNLAANTWTYIQLTRGKFNDWKPSERSN